MKELFPCEVKNMKRKYQKPLNKQKWNKQIKFYHNRTTQHFLLGVARRGDYVAGHDMTSHPLLTLNGKPKSKYLTLSKNPNPDDNRISYINKHIRKNIKIHFDDPYSKRLKIKKNWKLSKRDKEMIQKIDRKKI